MDTTEIVRPSSKDDKNLDSFSRKTAASREDSNREIQGTAKVFDAGI